MTEASIAVIQSKLEDMHEDIKETKKQVKLTNGTVQRHDVRIGTLEKFCDTASNRMWAIAVVGITAVVSAIVNIIGLFQK